MSKKFKAGSNGIVYSTDPSFQPEGEHYTDETLPASAQVLRIWLDTKLKGGKTATLIKGFEGKEADLEALGKNLKSLCGSGGAVKEGTILIQGDHRDKIWQWLLKNGYNQAKKAGG